MSSSYLGIDISKSKFHAPLQLHDKPKQKPKVKVFKNDTSGFEQLQEWIERQGSGVVHACLEATSTYGEAIILKVKRFRQNQAKQGGLLAEEVASLSHL